MHGLGPVGDYGCAYTHICAQVLSRQQGTRYEAVWVFHTTT